MSRDSWIVIRPTTHVIPRSGQQYFPRHQLRDRLALADEVVYVEHGRVLARGTHEELLAAAAGYRNLLTAYERDAAERAALQADEERDRADVFVEDGTAR